MAGEIFISYRRADQAKAGLLYQLLKDRGVDAWYDALLDAGDDWRSKTAHALVAAPIFVLLFSKTAAESDDISKELAAATFQKKTVIPVRIDNIHPEGAFLYELASRNWFDAYENTEERLAVLADRLAALVKGKPEEAKAAALKLGAPLAVTEAHAPPPVKVALSFRDPRVIGAAAALAVAAAGVFFLTREPATPVPPTPPDRIAGGGGERIAFFGFTADDDPASKAAAAAATDEGFRMSDALHLDTVARADTGAASDKPTLDRARDLGARFAVDGDIRREGDRLRGSLRMVDVASRTTIVQNTYDGDVSKPLELAYRIGLRAANRPKCVLAYIDSYGGRQPEASSLPLMGKACATEYSSEILPNLRELVRRNPQGVVENSRLADELVWSIPSSPETMRLGMLAEADAAQERAEKLGADAYVSALSRTTLAVAHNQPPLKWLPRLEQAVQRPPRPEEAMFHARANAYTGTTLLMVGRIADANRYLQIAMDSDPGYTNWSVYYGLTRAALGLYGASETLRPLLPRVSDYTWEVTLSSAIFLNALDPELVLAATPDSAKSIIPCYRGLIASLKAKDTKTRLAGASKADACLTAFDSPHINIQAQSMLGDLDRAFAIADRSDYTAFIWRYYSPLFLGSTKAMRADPRFLPLMQKLGFVEYWKGAKTRPDLCSTPEEADIALCKALAG